MAWKFFQALEQRLWFMSLWLCKWGTTLDFFTGRKIMLTVHLGIVPLFAFHSTSKHYNTGVDKGLEAIIPSKKETLSILHIQDLSWSFLKTSFYFFLSGADFPLMLSLSLCKTNNLFFWKRLIFHTKVFQSALIGILNTLHF